MDLQGPDLSDFRGAVVLFSNSRDPIFNSRDLNWVHKTSLKNW